jgi:hypothetical protein
MLEELGEDQVASETITIGLDRSAIEIGEGLGMMGTW